jgi:glycerophosphoryl diester phosphodiesterase
VDANPMASARRRPAVRALLVSMVVAAIVLVVLVMLLRGLGLRGQGPRGQGSGGTPTALTLGAASPSATSAVGGDVGTLVVLAHQGGNETYPLETLPAFVAAAKSGAAVETDVHWTSDGVAVLVHDDRTTAAGDADREHPMVCSGGPYTVSKTRWSVLRDRCRTAASAAEDGRQYPIPTFDEAMKAIAAIPGADVVPELKPEHPSARQIDEYLAVVTKYEMAERTVASSFFPKALAALRARAEHKQVSLRYLLMVSDQDQDQDQDQARLTPKELSGQGLWGVALRSDIATRENIAGVHAQHLVTVVWTINSREQWSAAEKAGADLVLTDRPDEYRATRPAHGRPLTPAQGE